MPISFDLSGLDNTVTKRTATNYEGVDPNSNNTFGYAFSNAQTHPNWFAPQPTALTFTIGTVPQSTTTVRSQNIIGSGVTSNINTGLVRRFAQPVLKTFGIGAGSIDMEKCSNAEDDENDQYTIPKGKSMCWAVLCRNDNNRKHPKSLLGDYGHLERLSSWIHLVSGVVFGVYAALRPTVITKEHTLAESFTTAAAVAMSFCFFSSTVYHITSPSERLAFWTRQLDFTGIYTAIAFGCVADFSIATRSFQNVSLISILDVPIAALIVCVFFLFRRGLLPSSDTWSSYLGGCTATFGLFRRMHIDKAHTGARQATSFLLVTSYFVSTPSLFNTLGRPNAFVVVGIEIACLVSLVIGMVVDNAFVFPDKRLSEGKGPKFLVCKPCGCIGSAHAVWHIFSVIAAVKGSVARELALSWQ